MENNNKSQAYPDDNPKTAIGVTKAPLHLVPPAAIHHCALAFADGAKKYGPYNWRDKTVSSSVYIGAMKRHIDAWWDGEDLSPDALVEHLGHVMACCAIILDAKSIGKLNDDRPTPGAASKLQVAYAEAHKEDKEIGRSKDAVVPGGLPNVQAHVRAYAGNLVFRDGQWFTLDGRVVPYSLTGIAGNGQPA